MDMAIQIMIFEGFPLLLGKGSGGGHCHTKTSSEKLSSLSSGKGKGWWRDMAMVWDGQNLEPKRGVL